MLYSLPRAPSTFQLGQGSPGALLSKTGSGLAMQRASPVTIEDTASFHLLVIPMAALQLRAKSGFRAGSGVDYYADVELYEVPH